MKEYNTDFVFLYHPHPYDVDPGSQIGLGLLLLASYAVQLGSSVRVINAQSMKMDEAISVIPKCKYLMMYGCLIDIKIIEKIAEGARKQADAICVGGPIAISHRWIGISNVDFIIDGYGEDFIAVSSNLKNETCLFSSLMYHIDYYPAPDRSLIEGGYGGNIFKREIERCEVSTTFLTSRGCKYKCGFCTSGSEDFFQEYSLDRIEEELEHCLSLNIQNIRISDDNLVSNPKRLRELCDLFKDAKIKWRGSIRVSPNNSGMYQRMRESGCEELSFGVESGDQNVLDILNKGAAVSQGVKAIQGANNEGILTRALMMMGTPGETKDTLNRNISWIERAKPDMVSLKMFVPYPGTDIYNNPDKYNCILNLTDINNSAYRPNGSQPQANINSEELNREELTDQFLEMKTYLEDKGIENRG